MPQHPLVRTAEEQQPLHLHQVGDPRAAAHPRVGEERREEAAALGDERPPQRLRGVRRGRAADEGARRLVARADQRGAAIGRVGDERDEERHAARAADRAERRRDAVGAVRLDPAEEAHQRLDGPRVAELGQPLHREVHFARRAVVEDRDPAVHVVAEVGRKTHEPRRLAQPVLQRRRRDLLGHPLERGGGERRGDERQLGEQLLRRGREAAPPLDVVAQPAQRAGDRARFPLPEQLHRREQPRPVRARAAARGEQALAGIVAGQLRQRGGRGEGDRRRVALRGGADRGRRRRRAGVAERLQRERPVVLPRRLQRLAERGDGAVAADQPERPDGAALERRGRGAPNDPRQRLGRPRLAQVAEPFGGGLAHGGVRIVERLDEARAGARVADPREGDQRRAPVDRRRAPRPGEEKRGRRFVGQRAERAQADHAALRRTTRDLLGERRRGRPAEGAGDEVHRGRLRPRGERRRRAAQGEGGGFGVAGDGEGVEDGHRPRAGGAVELGLQRADGVGTADQAEGDGRGEPRRVVAAGHFGGDRRDRGAADRGQRLGQRLARPVVVGGADPREEVGHPLGVHRFDARLSRRREQGRGEEDDEEDGETPAHHATDTSSAT